MYYELIDRQPHSYVWDMTKWNDIIHSFVGFFDDLECQSTSPIIMDEISEFIGYEYS